MLKNINNKMHVGEWFLVQLFLDFTELAECQEMLAAKRTFCAPREMEEHR